MRIALALLTSVSLTVFACAPEDDEDLLSDASEEGEEEVMSDDGLGSSADALTGTIQAGTVAYTTARINFRATASSSGRILRVVASNTAVKLVDGRPSNGFYKVEHNGDVGYMHGAYLTTGASDNSGDPNVSNTGRRVSTTALYLGSCEFLGTCASAATKRAWRANRHIILGCDGETPCAGDDFNVPYLSVPRNGPSCGSTVRICRVVDPSECVNAKVRERSDRRQRYELSPAAALAIGLDPHDRYFNPTGSEAACSGSMSGDARVTIRY